MNAEKLIGRAIYLSLSGPTLEKCDQHLGPDQNRPPGIDRVQPGPKPISNGIQMNAECLGDLFNRVRAVTFHAPPERPSARHRRMVERLIMDVFRGTEMPPVGDPLIKVAQFVNYALSQL